MVRHSAGRRLQHRDASAISPGNKGSYGTTILLSVGRPATACTTEIKGLYAFEWGEGRDEGGESEFPSTQLLVRRAFCPGQRPSGTPRRVKQRSRFAAEGCALPSQTRRANQGLDLHRLRTAGSGSV